MDADAGARTCVDKVIWEGSLRLAVLLAVKQRLWLKRPVVLPLQSAVVQADIVKAAGTGTWLPIPVVLAPLETCSSFQYEPWAKLDGCAVVLC